MFTLKVREKFSAAHAVRMPSGILESIHGHNWTVEIAVSAPALNSSGLAVDFLELKKLLHETVVKLDHTFLNKTGFFPPEAATTEHVALWILKGLEGPIEALEPNAKLTSVTVWETPDCAVTVTKEEND